MKRRSAATLRSLDDDPVTRFYHGEIARTSAQWMKAHGGLITADDLAQYRPVWRTPLHRAYRDYEVWTMPPPSSGGVVLEILGMLAGAPVSGLGVDSPPYLARLIEVMREGFIDRAQYADPDFVHVPIDVLLSQRHIDEALRARAASRRTRASGAGLRPRHFQLCWWSTRTATWSPSPPPSIRSSAPR